MEKSGSPQWSSPLCHKYSQEPSPESLDSHLDLTIASGKAKPKADARPDARSFSHSQRAKVHPKLGTHFLGILGLRIELYLLFSIFTLA